MRLSELLECAKPLLFEDGFEGYEYSGGGTFFFARFSGRYYAITAKHCLRGRNKESIRLFIEESSEGDDLIPIRRLHLIDDPSDRSDWADLAFMELRDESLSDAQKNAPWFVNFDGLIQREVTLREGDLVVTRGCPNSIGEIDYENSKVRHGFFTVDGRYLRPGVDPHTHIFAFSDLSQIGADPNGMSGSPVFKLRQWSKGTDYWFVGVLQRANKAQRIGQFVDCAVIFKALQMLSNKSHKPWTE